MVDVSVIVPVYNVEKYLKKCLDSLVNQKCENYEVILIDDGSTDHSGVICDQYKELYSNFIVIHQKNGGLVDACKRGISESSGSYMTFVDSDDWVDDDYLKILIETAKLSNADVVYGYAYTENAAQNQTEPQTVRLEPGTYNRLYIERNIFPTLISNFKINGNRSIGDSRWGKLYRSQIVRNNLDYYDSRVKTGEDFLFIVPIIMDCQVISVPEERTHLYHWRIVSDSMSHAYKPDLITNYVYIIQKLKQMILDKRQINFGQQIDKYVIDCMINSLLNEKPRLIDKHSSHAKKELKKIITHPIVVSNLRHIQWPSYSFNRKVLLILVILKQYRLTEMALKYF